MPPRRADPKFRHPTATQFRKSDERNLYLILIIIANATGFVALIAAFHMPGMELVRWSLLLSALTGAGAGLLNWMMHG